MRGCFGAGIAASHSSRDLARFLNRHFTLLAGSVEDEDGTVDKYIGDSMMAFWGAPEDQPDHAERAFRAALDIASRIRSHNAERREQGLDPIRRRIGLHSGPAIVGNIGAPGRVDYTIVGDTVNVAQRLEQLGKRVHDGVPEVAVLVSDETASHLPSRDGLEAAGAYDVPGREQPVEVFKLV